MKTIFMSIRPKHLCNILNGKKTIEIRKRFPLNFRGWVNLYCTKAKPYLARYLCSNTFDLYSKNYFDDEGQGRDYLIYDNGKVVARFFVDNVEEINSSLGNPKIYTQACISDADAYKYGNGNIIKAIHISKLEIFNTPKEIGEFKVSNSARANLGSFGWAFSEKEMPSFIPLKRAPQSWCYVEEK